uniref:ACYPI006477 protein n=1 Tax=Acyrthosiphon pisum TaxID=7029 RepID=C4WY84_ACYPI|nr:ACYPI006477 [Acyrthosiphon pisum]
MSVNVGLEDSYQNSHNGAFQSYRPIKALMMYVQRRNSIMGNEPCDTNIGLPSSSWSDSTSQNIHLKLTCQGTYLKDTTTWSDMQYEAEDTVSEIKILLPKKDVFGKS